jgi:uncharacterized protein (DUF952 family)
MNVEPIYHIVTEADFRAHSDGVVYLPADFAASGFVHCALEASVLPVANDYYGAVRETLLLLKIDPARLKSPTRYEAADPSPDAGASHLASSPVFPHVYGPIDLGAIDGVGVLAKGGHGYEWPAEFGAIGLDRLVAEGRAAPTSRSIADLPDPVRLEAGATTASDELRRMREDEGR